jgi:hypothetical protein
MYSRTVLDLGAGKRSTTPEGFLRVPIVIARSGIQLYTAEEVGDESRPPGEVVRVWRPPDEVFSPDAISSFRGKPITNDHPGELIDAASIGDIESGWSGWTCDDVRRDGDLLIGTAVVARKDAIQDINAGKKELSGGYSAVYEVVSGVSPAGESYDAIQTKIRGNHVAIVKAGRCGAACRIADHKTGATERLHREGHTVKIQLGGKDHEVSDDTASAITAITDASAAKDTELEELQAKFDAEKAARDGLAQKLLDKNDEGEEEEEDEGLEEEEDEFPFEKKEKGEDKKLSAKDASKLSKKALIAHSDRLQARLDANDSAAHAAKSDERVHARADLIADARRLFPAVETHGQKAHAIRCEVIRACTDKDMSDKSRAYVSARFDMLKEGGGEADRFIRRNPADGVVPDKCRDARRASMDRSANAWKSDKDK